MGSHSSGGGAGGMKKRGWPGQLVVRAAKPQETEPTHPTVRTACRPPGLSSLRDPDNKLSGPPEVPGPSGDAANLSERSAERQALICVENVAVGREQLLQRLLVDLHLQA